jgi:hypothetical protein
VSLTVSPSLCLTTVSLTVPPHCVSHCVSLTVSLSLCLSLCLPHCVQLAHREPLLEFELLVGLTLCSSGDADLARMNPCLTPELCHTSRHLTFAIMLHVNRLSQLSVCQSMAADLQRTLAVLCAGGGAGPHAGERRMNITQWAGVGFRFTPCPFRHARFAEGLLGNLLNREYW